MGRREFLGILSGTAAAWPLSARAQQPALPVIGYVNLSPARSSMEAALRQGLSETGYSECQNVTIEYHWAEGNRDRLSAIVADLVRRRVSVIAAIQCNQVAVASFRLANGQ